MAKGDRVQIAGMEWTVTGVTAGCVSFERAQGRFTCSKTWEQIGSLGYVPPTAEEKAAAVALFDRIFR